MTLLDTISFTCDWKKYTKYKYVNVFWLLPKNVFCKWHFKYFSGVLNSGNDCCGATRQKYNKKEQQIQKIKTKTKNNEAKHIKVI